MNSLAEVLCICTMLGVICFCLQYLIAVACHVWYGLLIWFCMKHWWHFIWFLRESWLILRRGHRNWISSDTRLGYIFSNQIAILVWWNFTLLVWIRTGTLLHTFATQWSHLFLWCRNLNRVPTAWLGAHSWSNMHTLEAWICNDWPRITLAWGCTAFHISWVTRSSRLQLIVVGLIVQLVLKKTSPLRWCRALLLIIVITVCD